MKPALAILTLLSSACSPLLSQSTPTFRAADVHISAPARDPFFEGFGLHGDRYSLLHATMTDLVAIAYGTDKTNVQGGPSWLDQDRFDVIATTPASTSQADLKLMLQALLADRFHLVVHTGQAPMPTYILTADGPSKLKPAPAGAEDGRCEFKPPAQPGALNYIAFSCHNLSMDILADSLHQWVRGYLDHPVVNSTGLAGGFDFDLRWSDRGALAQQGADGISIFDALEKQLGLKLQLSVMPRTVTIVDKVNQRPAPNPPGVEKLLVAPPRTLEVATIKPSRPGTQMALHATLDSIVAQGTTMRQLMDMAWDLNPDDTEIPLNAPKWFDSDKFDILAKIANEDPKNAWLVPWDDIRGLLRGLLTERFQIKTHTEVRPVNSFQLLAVNPKLKNADPASRSICAEGPGQDGKDPRLDHPILSRLITCRNTTMQQFGDELQRISGGFVYGPVLDSTGLTGGWDFTLSFSRPQDLAAGSDATPNGALSLADALTRQLGLKLEKMKRPLPVLVIDHIEEKPTEN